MNTKDTAGGAQSRKVPAAAGWVCDQGATSLSVNGGCSPESGIKVCILRRKGTSPGKTGLWSFINSTVYTLSFRLLGFFINTLFPFHNFCLMLVNSQAKLVFILVSPSLCPFMQEKYMLLPFTLKFAISRASLLLVWLQVLPTTSGALKIHDVLE